MVEEGVGQLILEWVSVFLGGVGLGLSVAILVVLWRVWGNTDRAEQDGRERLEILREQQARLEHLREERRVLLEELERLREQKERLRWLREGRAGLLAELRRLRSQVEERRAETLSRATPSVPAKEHPVDAIEDRRNGHAPVANGHTPVANGHAGFVEVAKKPDEAAAPGSGTHPGDTEAGEAAQSPKVGEEQSPWWRRIFGGP